MPSLKKKINFDFDLPFLEEILVIIDYCRFGNLKSFLFENRDKFVNELNGIGTTLPAWNVTATTSRTQQY
jgi:hypothetical protein